MFFSAIFFDAGKAYAVDITAGATTWYARGEQYSASGTFDDHVGSDPAFLFGPTLSVKLNENFNLTFVYLYGKFDYKAEHGTTTDDFKSVRSDTDLALNYRLNDYFKVFAGIKYLAFDMMQVEYFDGTSSFMNDGNHTCFCGGLGISAVFPIMENLFLLGTISGLYGHGKDKIYASGSSFKTGFDDYGLNANLSIAYYIAPASTTISLGARTQYFKTKYSDKFPVTVENQIYGITLTAAYSFNI